MAGEIDPSGNRKQALDAFLARKVDEGFRIETHTDTHAIVVGRNRRSLSNVLRRRNADRRYVVSVDEHGEITMIPAEPIRR
jgi:hypothetical protein